MKFSNIISTVLISLVIISCKKTENAQPTVEGNMDKKATEAKSFNLEIDAVASKKDNLAMYFTEDGTNNFTQDNAVWRDIKGGQLTEKILFNLPEDRIPTQIRLDFGLNKEQEFIEIHNIKISYGANSFEFKGADFFTFFTLDPNFKTEVDQSKGILKILKKDKEYKTPFYYPTQTLVDKIKALILTK